MAELLKNQFFTTDSLNSLADNLLAVYPGFDRDHFLALIYDETWESRELKAKMRHTTRAMGMVLPADYPSALDILHQAVPQVRGFEAMCFPDFVELYGLEHWDLSMPALEYFTRFGSSEFAVRPFLDRDPDRGMVYFRTWALDSSEHVRRLASEGCRPRLPWAMALPKFKADPSPILPVLEMLKDDESEYVRRSVANNLNDISKDHPELVLDVCERWLGKSERTDGIVRHALRSLLKQGEPRALALFGVEGGDHLTIVALSLEQDHLKIGETLSFSYRLRVDGEKEVRVRLEYAVYFAKFSGRLSRKVFQLAEKNFAPGEYSFSKKHSLEDRTTRKHYPGEHKLEVIVNGAAKALVSFWLEPAGSNAG
jgi:3-methyladenine DNA glycosylase AlkC